MGENSNTISTVLLLHQLTEKLGLPLANVVADGRLPEQIATKMTDNCKTCASPSKCQSFLEARPGKLAAPPSFCVNCRLLTFLGKTLPPSQ